MAAATLLCRGALGEVPSPDCRMCIQRLALLGLAQLGNDFVGRGTERVLPFGQQRDESGVALEELRELSFSQLPR